MDLLAGSVVPAEGELTIRTYHCTYYRNKELGLKSGGFLGITNKRVIFLAEGETRSGKSVIQSEVPIADVSGINSYKGTCFNILSMLGVLMLSWLTMALVPAILTTLSYTLESYAFFQVVGWILVLGGIVSSFLLSVKSLWRTVLVGVSAGALLSLAGLSALNLLSMVTGNGRGNLWIFLLVIGALIYLFMCAAWYARQPTFSLEINSSGGSSTPIHIASGGGFLNMAPASAPNALPGRDAETMLKEIGALITDIQTLGDYGIAKWKQN